MNSFKKIFRDIATKRLRSKFHSFGLSSVLDKPRLLEGSNSIAVGDHVYIREGAWLGTYPTQTNRNSVKLSIKDGVYIGFFSCLTAIEGLTIESGAMISDYFYASDHTHGCDPRLGPPASQPLTSKGPVLIGKNCFIGYRVTIMPGVSLGESCVVGAHSVITKSFPPFTMLAGTPAIPIKKFHFGLGKWTTLAG